MPNASASTGSNGTSTARYVGDAFGTLPSSTSASRKHTPTMDRHRRRDSRAAGPRSNRHYDTFGPTGPSWWSPLPRTWLAAGHMLAGAPAAGQLRGRLQPLRLAPPRGSLHLWAICSRGTRKVCGELLVRSRVQRRELIRGHQRSAGVVLAAARRVACRVDGELAGLDVAGVAREEADERLERVAIGQVTDGGREVEAVGAGDRDDLPLIRDERHARDR